MNDVIDHYNKLIEEENDPVHDPQPLKEYMNKWDGERFVNSMQINQSKSILEIGVGTGRLAIKTAPLCASFTGIDISPKTVQRATANLKIYDNVKLICDDFMCFHFDESFDVVYSSLTFMHIENKSDAIVKISSLLKPNGLFVLSIDKNQDKYIDMGIRKIRIFPDDPISLCLLLEKVKLNIIDKYETEHAYVIVSKKASLV